MESLQQVIEIAESLNYSSIVEQLRAIEARARDKQTPLVIPFVGEFSAGKTSLINALTDSKVLEVASKETTATIYQIFFGQPENKAVAINEAGEEVALDLASLKNDDLQVYPVVNLYDTSTKVPSDILFVDTPGLSSPDPKHKEVLIRTLPMVDAILLTVDINQPLTKSLLDFVKGMKLSDKPIYLVLAKADTKSPKEIAEVKAGISREIDLPLSSMIAVSAKAGEIQELQQLLHQIQQKKDEIITKVNALRTKALVAELRSAIAEILRSSESPKELEEAVRTQDKELQRLQSNIGRLIEGVEDRLQDYVQETAMTLRSQLWSSLNGILSQKSGSYNDSIEAEVKRVKMMLLQNFTQKVESTIREVNSSSRDSQVQLPSASTLNLEELGAYANGIQMQDFDSIGHGWDKTIGWATIGVVGAAAVAATGGLAAFGIGGSAAAAGGATATGSAVAAGLEVAETAAAVGTVAKVSRMSRTMQAIKAIGTQGVTKVVQKGMEIDQMVTSAAGREKSFIGGMVGKVTEFFSKPRREAAVAEFLDMQILPNFEADLNNYLAATLSQVSTQLNAESEIVITEKKAALRQLQEQQKQAQAAYKERIRTLKEQDSYLANLAF